MSMLREMLDEKTPAEKVKEVFENLRYKYNLTDEECEKLVEALGGSGGAESSPVITHAILGDAVGFDKTFAELSEAYKEGKEVIAIVNVGQILRYDCVAINDAGEDSYLTFLKANFSGEEENAMAFEGFVMLYNNTIEFRQAYAGDTGGNLPQPITSGYTLISGELGGWVMTNYVTYAPINHSMTLTTSNLNSLVQGVTDYFTVETNLGVINTNRVYAMVESGATLATGMTNHYVKITPYLRRAQNNLFLGVLVERLTPANTTFSVPSDITVKVATIELRNLVSFS